MGQLVQPNDITRWPRLAMTEQTDSKERLSPYGLVLSDGRVLALKDFTYQYKEEIIPPTPVEPTLLYWYKGTVTIETDGGSGYPDWDTSEGDFWSYISDGTPVNIIWNDTLYEDVPNEGGVVGEGDGSPDYTNYPFYIINDDGGVCVYAKTAGEYTIKLEAGEFIINTLTVKNDETSLSIIYPAFNKVSENNILTPNHSLDNGIDIGESLTENVVYYGADPEDPEQYPDYLASIWGIYEKTAGNALYDANSGYITLPDDVTIGSITLKDTTSDS